MRIAIVNDRAIAVEVIERVLRTVKDYELAWVAGDGAQAVAKCVQDPPDLILMDLIMPIMDGVEATCQIMNNSPCAILVVTASVGRNAAKVFEAMGYGALDAVRTPVLGSNGIPEAAHTLLAKVAMIGKLIGKSGRNSQSRVLNQGSHSIFSSIPSFVPPLVAIGSSTGGPTALTKILSGLPANFGAAVVVIQHVDAEFTSSFVEWLAPQTPLKVELASAGNRLEVGKVMIAGKNEHLSLQPNFTLSYTKDPIDYPYRPSIDVFFKSLVQNWKRQETAVILTGMGRDGAEGLSLLRGKGWHTIAQNQETSVVYGMPKAAVELGAAVEILPIEAIASALVKQIATRR